MLVGEGMLKIRPSVVPSDGKSGLLAEAHATVDVEHALIPTYEGC